MNSVRVYLSERCRLQIVVVQAMRVIAPMGIFLETKRTELVVRMLLTNVICA